MGANYTIKFNYMQTQNILKLVDILEEDRANGFATIREMSKRYILVDQNDDPYYVECPISDIVQSDITDTFNTNIDYLNIYRKLLDRYGSDIMSLLIPPDRETIQKKISNILHFAMDKVFKVSDDDVVEIRIAIYPSRSDCITSTPNDIIVVLHKEFKLLDMSSNAMSMSFFVKKKLAEEESL